MKSSLFTVAILMGVAHGLCGDCNADGAVNVLDALTGAQAAAGTLTVPPMQVFDCDVDSSGSVDILDALLIAQFAAGLPVTLTCIVPNSPPVLTIDYFPPNDAGIVPFYYSVSDVESDPVDVVFEVSTDGGATWAAATAQAGLSVAPTTTALPTSAAGEAYLFLWDSVTDARTLSGMVDVRAWAMDAAAGPLAMDSLTLANASVTRYTTECIMESNRHQDMASIPLYVVLRSFSTSAQTVMFGSTCQENYEIDRPAFNSTPIICGLAITSVIVPAGGVYEWPVHTHTPGDFYCAPGTHEVIAVSRDIGGHVDSTPLTFEVF